MDLFVKKMVKVGYVQNSPVLGDKKGNFEDVEKLVSNIKADLLVLPELFATGYNFSSKDQVKKLSETGEGETATFLKEISNKTGAVIVAGFIEEDKGNYYNSSMMVYKDEVIDVYRKLHLFSKEKGLFSPGDKQLSVHLVNGMKIGVMICFDWIFPEVARKLALLGAQIIAHPVNLVMPYCQQAMVTRCLENGVFSVTANRVGKEKTEDYETRFTGSSQVTSNKGEILASANLKEACIEILDIDINEADNKMINGFDDIFKDRREKFY